ncbi:glycosyltransferase family 4 protein [Sphingomonas hengshuiensis]|uniref:GDP-mannose-dependent alpha-mannosyltransferase n=1 Tax=Sphingomonas hengshuiensis TaxID=1609977 RepID=A0A7U5CV80_9SPHN|nr:glycosyltransferase family 1 protein [Sphingomonas hengshuiensis]AJP74569.1 GDP-mannose-dependent alpha-mannosyltransferase [Sphingomonas hengshuiensis]
MRIAIVTDAWEPQVNGVVRTLQSVRDVLVGQGHVVKVISPDLFYSLPCPTYPEIRLAITRTASVGAMLEQFRPSAIHLATEGPLCVAARRWCLRNHRAFTTAYHTQFPDYVSARSGVPAEWIWHYIRWFHAPSSAILASTPSIRESLAAHGLKHVRHWGRGVDLANFHPRLAPHPAMAGLAGPVQLYVGRVAVEKNIEAFLQTTHPGTKVVVGDGPARASLEARFPDAHFLGPMFGAELASAYAGADVFVFPSRTDTFGLVMIEALACGVPVAGYPVTGPIDVLTDATGATDEDLTVAIGRALTKDRRACAAYGRTFTWEASARQFLNALVAREEEDEAA